MSEKAEQSGGALSGLAGKALALVVLLIAAWILFKIVIGVVAAVAWTIVAIVAVVAVLWALNRLL
jgi:predicted membrane protein